MEDRGHSVRFYEDDEALCSAVAAFLHAGMARGAPAVAILTSEHLDLVEDELRRRGTDPGRARRTGALRFLDARQALDGFMRGGDPDPARFRDTFTRLIEGLPREPPRDNGDPRPGPRIFGEMVDVLYRDGEPDAALRVEALWNELVSAHPFQLLCAYAMERFDGASDSDRFREICAQHQKVIPAESWSDAREVDERERQIALLQHKARALEAELARRRKLEVALRGALQERDRANRSRSVFCDLMSHELRTPLTAIIGYGDLLDLELKGPINQDQRAFLRGLRSEAQRLLVLIDRAFAVTRGEGDAGRGDAGRPAPSVKSGSSEADDGSAPV